MITEDTKVLNDGTVKGTLKYVEGYAAFGSPTEGHYFPVRLGEQYRGKRIKVTGKNTKTETDLDWVLYVEDNATPFKFVNADDGDAEIVTLNFSEATLQPNPVTLSKRRTRKVAKPLTED